MNSDYNPLIWLKQVLRYLISRPKCVSTPQDPYEFSPSAPSASKRETTKKGVQRSLDLMVDFYDSHIPTFYKAGDFISEKQDEYFSLISRPRSKGRYFSVRMELIFNNCGWVRDDSLRFKALLEREPKGARRRYRVITHGDIKVESPILAFRSIPFAYKEKRWCKPISLPEFNEHILKMYDFNSDLASQIAFNLRILPDKIHN